MVVKIQPGNHGDDDVVDVGDDDVDDDVDDD